MSEKYSGATLRAWSVPTLAAKLVPHFTRGLGRKPIRYEWRFIKEGDFWFYDRQGEEVMADADYVDILAFA